MHLFCSSCKKMIPNFIFAAVATNKYQLGSLLLAEPHKDHCIGAPWFCLIKMSGIYVYIMGRLSEVQLLVLLSFILQLFLFSTGGLRRRRRNWLVRSTIWIAYLGADVVAIYALGFLSRHADAMHNDDDASLRLAHPLAFLWAPFLLIHLGGQDTITAFAIEDNKLWLRHLLNLLLQVTLALYVFWKSSSWHSTQVLVPGILVFVAGIIKYGERTTALRQANLNNMVIISMRKSTSTNNNNNTSSSNLISNNNSRGEQQILPADIICEDALRSAPGIRMLFARRKTPQVATDLTKIISPSYNDRPSSIRHRDLFRLMDVELGMIYSDVYTKAAVLRTKRGIVFRCISLACTVAALILFFFFTSSSSRADHHDTTNTTAGRVDTAITYTLFIGGLVVDICSLLTMVMASPWTCAWLRHQGYHRIASMSLRRLVSCNMVSGWLGTITRPLWSNTMGQYRFVCYDDDSQLWSSSPPPPPPPTPSERVMCIIRKLVSCSEEEKKLFWLSKLLETKHVVVDDNVTKCLVEATSGILQSSGGGSGEVHQPQQWKCLGQLLLAATQPECTKDFVHLICWLHACTEVLLCEAAAAAECLNIADATTNAAASADVCRKLSRYMVYLVAVHPAGDELLQVVSTHADKEYKSWERYSNISLRGKQHQIRMGLLRLELEAANKGCGCGSSPSTSVANRVCGCGSCSTASRILALSLPHPESPERWQQTLEELKRMWARLLVYAAAKSRPEAHAAELARGGELLTFVWLLLSHNGLGADFQVDLVPRSGKHHQHVPESSASGGGGSKTYYIFKNLPAVQMVVNNCCPLLLLPPQQPAKLTTTPTPTTTGSPPVKLASSTVDP